MTNATSGGTTLSSFAYSYNNDSLRSGVTEADSSTVSYGYDGQNHLTSETCAGTNAYTIAYTVDGAGNRTAQTVGGTSTTLTYDNDDELSYTTGGFTNSYSYNANGDQTGRTLSGTGYTLTFDEEDQLTGTGGATFTYDALGRRMSRTASSTTTSFLLDGSAVLLEKQGSTTSATYSYGTALTRKDGEFPLFDALGSERTVTSSSQISTGALNLDSFGNSVGGSGSSASPYTFAATSGYRSDGDAGLSFVGARYYDAQMGRFISRDTYLDQKPYAYCDSDPVNAVDPSGHDAGWANRRTVNDPYGEVEDKKPIPYPWPYGRGPITVERGGGVDVKAGAGGKGLNVEGGGNSSTKNTISVDPVAFWRNLPVPVQLQHEHEKLGKFKDFVIKSAGL